MLFLLLDPVGDDADEVDDLVGVHGLERVEELLRVQGHFLVATGEDLSEGLFYIAVEQGGSLVSSSAAAGQAGHLDEQLGAQLLSLVQGIVAHPVDTGGIAEQLLSAGALKGWFEFRDGGHLPSFEVEALTPGQEASINLIQRLGGDQTALPILLFTKSCFKNGSDAYTSRQAA